MLPSFNRGVGPAPEVRQPKVGELGTTIDCSCSSQSSLFSRAPFSAPFASCCLLSILPEAGASPACPPSVSRSLLALQGEIKGNSGLAQTAHSTLGFSRLWRSLNVCVQWGQGGLSPQSEQGRGWPASPSPPPTPALLHLLLLKGHT